MPEDKLPIPQFAAKIKAKYPEYKDVNDTLLVQRIVEKYPEYRESVDLSGIEDPSKKKGMASSAFSGALQDGSKAATSATPSEIPFQKESVETLLSRVPQTKPTQQYTDISKRYADATEILFDENDPVKSALTPIENKLAEQRKKQVSSSTSTPVSRMAFSNEATDLINQKKRIEDLRFGNSLEAEDFLSSKIDQSRLQRIGEIDMTKKLSLDDFSIESISAATPQDNLTAQKAFEQYKKNRQTREAIASSTSLGDAAVKMAVAKNDVTGKQITELSGDIPDAMKGNITLSFLQDEEVRELAERYPEFASRVKQEFFELPKKYPNTAVRILAQIISEERGKRGENNAILNITSAKTSDEIINDLYEKGELPLQYKNIYENPAIRFAVNAKLKTPGLLENVGSGLGESVLGIGKTVSDATGIRELYSTDNERMYNELQKQYEDFKFNPKGLLQKISTAGGNITGQVLPMMFGGAALKGLNVVKTTQGANAIMVGLQTWGNNRDRALVDLPGESEEKQFAYATLNTAIEMALASSFNDTKLAQSLMRKGAPEIKSIINKFTSKEISAAAAKEATDNTFKRLLRAGGDFAKGTSKTAVKEANEEGLTQLLQTANNQVFGGEDVTVQQAFDDAFDVWTTTLLGSIPLGAAGGFVEVNKNPEMPSLMLEMASNPDKYTNIIKAEAALDKEYGKDVAQKIANLNHIVSVKQELDTRGMDEKQQGKFLLKSLQEKMLAEKSATIPDKTLKLQSEKKIKEIEIEKNKILDPDISNTKLVEEFYDNDLLGKGSKMVLEDENGKFSTSKVGDYLKYVAQQANNLDENWKPHTGKAPSLSDIPNEIVKIANERWAKEIAKADDERYSGIELEKQETIPDQVREIDMGTEEITKPVDLSTELPEETPVKESGEESTKPVSEGEGIQESITFGELKSVRDEKNENKSTGTAGKGDSRIHKLDANETKVSESQARQIQVLRRERDRNIKRLEEQLRDISKRYGGKTDPQAFNRKDRQQWELLQRKLQMGYSERAAEQSSQNDKGSIERGDGSVGDDKKHYRSVEEGNTGTNKKGDDSGGGGISSQADLGKANVQRGVNADTRVGKKNENDSGLSEAEIENGNDSRRGVDKAQKKGVIKQDSGAIPPEPPKEAPEQPGEGGRLNDKGILNRLYEAKNVPEAAKEGFEKVGLKYEVQSQTEAQELAKGIIDEFGIDEAVTLAEANRFRGGVRSAVFAESLTRLSEQENAATTPEGKLEAAKKFAEIATRYDEFSREQGRDISQIDYFYKKSPLGVVIAENAKRKGEFDTWAKSKDKDWKTFFDEMMKEPEFEAVVKEQLKEGMKQERAEARKARIKKVDEFFDKAKDQFKGGAAYSTIIPPKVITAALEGMKQAYRAGEKVADLIQKAIDYISEELGNAPWDKEKFRKEWEDKLKEKKVKEPLTDEELKLKVLDKFRKKLSGLTEKQKEQVIRKAHRKLIENGALDFEDFKQIIGQVTGRGELTPEQAEQMKKLVKSVNGVEDAAKKVREERTPESFVQFRKAEIEAGKASRELNELFYNRTDIVKRLVSVMQLNTLGIPSLLNNPVYNFWNQLLMRFPVGLVNDIIDRGLSAAAKAAGKNYDREYNVLETQAKFFETLGFGAKEAISQLRTGLNRQDYLQKEVYGQQIRPIRAIKELIAYREGKKSLTKAQVFDKAIQATAGVPAEIIARFLNIGDKPQRFAAEGAQGSAFAKTLGLKGIDEQIFIEFPREEAYRAYKAQGFSDEVAAQKADYIKEAIIQEGKRSTFQQDNLLNDALTRAFGIFGGKDSGWANLAKTLTVSPYIKIPTNAFWSLYNLLNPEIAIIQASAHGVNSKRLNGKGEAVRSKLQAREARYWMAHAIVGMGMRAAVIALVKAGVFTPGSDGDDSKKERDAVSYWDKPGTTEINGIKISNRWFGQLGAMGNAIAKKYMDATPEQREKQDDFWNTIFGGMEVEGLKELQNGIFANSSGLFDAISNNNGDRYFTNILNMMANIVQPAAIAQINRAALNEVPSSRGDGFLDKLNQNFAQRSSLYRRLFDVKIDKKRDVWGQTIPKGGNILSRMFGISKADPQIFARPIYNDYLETSDSGFLPPAVLPIVNKQKLNKEQYDRLQEYVGSERKKLVEPYVNDMAMIPGFGFYSKIEDKEVKKAALEVLYEKGKETGLEKFYSDYPEFRPKDKEGEDAEKSENIKEMKQELKDF